MGRGGSLIQMHSTLEGRGVLSGWLRFGLKGRWPWEIQRCKFVSYHEAAEKEPRAREHPLTARFPFSYWVDEHQAAETGGRRIAVCTGVRKEVQGGGTRGFLCNPLT